MAKDLPYFKFFCSEWNDGDITLEDYEIQGLFINICSYYWSKECDVTKKLIKKRFRGQDKNIDYLVEEGLIKFNNEHLSIKFLNEQFSEVETTSKAKSEAGKKSALLKKLRKQIDKLCKDLSLDFNIDLTKLQHEFNTDSTDVDFLLQHISTIKIRRDKMRKDDSIEDEIIISPNVYTKDNFIKNWVEMNNGNSSLKQLSTDDLENFFTLNKLYGKEDFHKALNGMFKQKSLIDTCKSSPKHFLDINNFVKYLDAEKSGNYNLYKSFK